ncbi:MAG: hypothetical protein ACLQMH_07830 [Solirubrobacteraceae bacterium]
MIVLGTALMIAVALGLLASLINLWPSVEASTTTTTGNAASSATTHTVRLFFAAVSVTVTPGTALLLLVIIVGALGSLIQAATSFGDFVGNRRFYSSWVVWYLLRLVVGVLLALLLYFALRGGFFSGNSQSASVNPYGIAALAGLAGLFSKQATDKLREVFETMFRVSSSGGDAQRKDDLANPAPIVRGIEPSEVTAGDTQLILHIHGDHFIKGTSTVKAEGGDLDATFIGPQQLDVAVPDEMIAQEGSLGITVTNGPPGGGESHPPAKLAIVSPTAPVVRPTPAGPIE